MARRRKRWKKRLLILLAVLAAFAGAFYVLANRALEYASRLALAELPGQFASAGVQLIEPAYEEVSLVSPWSAHWSGFSSRIRMDREDSILSKGTELFVGSYGIEVSLVDLSFRRYLITFERLNIVPIHSTITRAPTVSIVANEEPIHGRITAPYARAIIEINPFSPSETIEILKAEAASLLEDGVTKLQVDCRGELSFNLKNRARMATIITEPTEAGYAFRLDPSDLMELAPLFDLPLTEAEVKMLAKYPLRVARLIEIKEHVDTVSGEFQQNDRKFAFDAFRHVYWNYLLSNAYGTVFAKEVTDAHELGAINNTEADHVMDYHNNGVGRRYSEFGLTEAQVFEKFKTDIDVMREPPN